MLKAARRLAILGATASIGSLLASGLSPLARVALPQVRRLNGDGLPVHERAPARNKRGHSVAHGKRMARKARNVKRHKAAMRG